MFIGMDVHQKTIDVTVAEEGRDGRVWHFGTIGGDLRSVDRAVDKLLEQRRPLYFVYEAGPCGFVLHRHLTTRGLDCTVVAPAQVPSKPSDRIKTDRRDAQKLACTHRAGQLRPIHVPEPADEAMRDLVRAREDAVERGRKARQQLNSFLLRHGRRYTRHKWTAVHRRWLSDLIFDLPAQRIVFEESITAIEECDRRVERLSGQIETLLPEWRFLPVVQALQALRGFSLIVSVTMVAELGDLTRFGPESLMHFIGIIPSEYTTGERRRQGRITKCGNAHVRRVLCEAAWAYDNSPAISRHLLKRQENLPKEVRDVAWKAQLRLCARFHHLAAMRKHRNKVNTAVARELCGFVWKIATLVPLGNTQSYRLKPPPRRAPGRRRIRVVAPAA
jgi:transposase